MMTYALCLMECESDLNCMSINFHMVTKKCELNAQTKETLPEIYKERQNSIYSTNMDNKNPSKCEYRLLPSLDVQNSNLIARQIAIYRNIVAVANIIIITITIL